MNPGVSRGPCGQNGAGSREGQTLAEPFLYNCIPLFLLLTGVFYHLVHTAEDVCPDLPRLHINTLERKPDGPV